MRVREMVTWKSIVAVLGLVASLLAIGAWVYPLVAETDAERTLRNTEEIQAALARGDDVSDGFSKEALSSSSDGDALAMLTSVGLRGGEWESTPLFAAPGNEIRVLVSLANAGENRLTDVTLGLVPGERLVYVEGSTVLVNGNHLEGVAISVDDVANGGINLGNYASGGWSYITFTVRVGGEGEWSCGTHSADIETVAKATSDKTGEQLPIVVSTPLLYIERVC